jgi:hypothetical protein
MKGRSSSTRKCQTEAAWQPIISGFHVNLGIARHCENGGPSRVVWEAATAAARVFSADGQPDERPMLDCLLEIAARIRRSEQHSGSNLLF